MSAPVVLVVFVFAFWGILAAAAKTTNLLGGRGWNAGPSLIPVIPFLPLVALLIGTLLNSLASPWGTGVIIALHFGWLSYSLFNIWMHPVKANNDQPK